MSEKSPSKLPSPAVLRQRRRAAAGLGVALAVLGVNEVKPIGNAAKWVGEPITRAIERANNGGETHELPAFDTTYTVQAGDTPDQIAALSGVQGSANRLEFQQKIIAQDSDGMLKAGDTILVPSTFVENTTQQKRQE